MKGISYSGRLYRALNPVYAREPMSGRGAALYGGRFNPKGMPALYASSSVMTALREANQVGDLQPTTLVCYRAQIEAVFDASRTTNLAEWDMDEAALVDSSWRDEMRRLGEARTQQLARRLAAGGYNAMMVRSFAKGAAPDDVNLVLWRWGDSVPSRLTLIDDEQRLA